MAISEPIELIKFEKILFKTDVRPLWCPGCGDFATLKAMKEVMFKLQWDPTQTLMVAGIGCSSKMNDALGVYGLHVIHGRAVPAAIGVKLSNYDLNVVAYGGDGDMTGIGGNHLAHACRRNIDMTIIVTNNKTYGLTTGQASPTSDFGYKTKTSPSGVVDKPVNPILNAIASGATFVARTSTSDSKHLTYVLEEAMQHKGTSFVEILQFCITFNRINTPDYYSTRLFDLRELNHNISSKTNALQMAELWGDKIPMGVFFKEDIPDYKEVYPQLKDGSIVKRRDRKPRDVTKLFESLM